MIEYIKQGGDPDEFLQYYFKELKSAFELRNEAVSQISEVWEENPELAKQFLQKVNEKFTEEGIKLINQEEFE
jgi:mevalonate kinase